MRIRKSRPRISMIEKGGHTMIEKCGCYHTQTERHYFSDFEKGAFFALKKTYPPDYEDREYGVCWGTKECERCKCDGDTCKCDFYPYKREKKGDN